MFGNKGGGLIGPDDIDPEDYKNCMIQGMGHLLPWHPLGRVDFDVQSFKYFF
jgi:hypothetical protein